MDFLLRLLTPGRVGAAALACAALIMAARHRRAILAMIPDTRPPIGAPDRLGREITEAREKQEKVRVETLYRSVSKRLEEAKAAGFNVAFLESQAQAAMSLNQGSTRREAIEKLTRIEFEIPRDRATGSEVPVPKSVSKPAKPAEPAVKKPEAPKARKRPGARRRPT